MESESMSMSIEKKLKHLDFIQNIITRMSNHSFVLKGWAVTLISALFALSANNENAKFIPVIYFIIVIFWILDGFFLSTERQYRAMYDAVREKDESEIDFSLDAASFKDLKNGWGASVFSTTLMLFYGIVIAATLAVKLLIVT